MTAATSFAKIPNFDARAVPSEGTDGHLPAVPAAGLTAHSLRQRWAQPPQWQPEISFEHRFTERAPAQAAVLVGLVQRNELMVLLTQRTVHMKNHSGQVAFAGGKSDPEDADAAATAVREAHEEVGVLPSQITVIGNLPTYTTGTAFVITPVVALVAPDYRLAPSVGEVAQVFEVPLAFLMNPANHHRHTVEWEGIRRDWFSMPYTDAEGEQRFIWGATAGMIRNFYRFLSANH